MLALVLTASASAQDALPPERDSTLRNAFEPDDPTLPRQTPRLQDADPGDDAPRRASRTEPNFGKRRPLTDPRLAYPGRPKQAKKPLPRTEPYRTAPAQIRRDYTRPQDPLPPTPYAQPAQIPRPPRPKAGETPYAPLGIEAGSLRLFPFAEASGGYDDNVNRSPASSPANIKPSTFTRLEGGLKAQSNWTVHEFKTDVTGTYSKYQAVPDADRPEAAAKFNLRLDATRETKVDLELRGTVTTQRPGSPEVNVNVVGRPPVFSYGVTGGLTRNFGRLETSIAALADRTTFEDGKLSNGNSVALSRDDFTAYGLRGRIGYEITPGVKPFAEVTVDTRQRDIPIDATGFQRNSNGLLARLGSTFELTRTLTGEVSAGYVNRKYADARLPELRGPTIDAALIWTATPLTTVTFRAATAANETTIANSSGYISRRGSVEINHALLRNLTLGGIATWQRDQYQGIALTQDVFTGTLKAEYALTRSVVVKGSFTHERLKSSTPGADYTANVYLLGLRLQR